MKELPLRQIIVVPPRRYGLQDSVEMFAIDDAGGLWHRLSDHRGGWSQWERAQGPEVEE
jgi:hypothetical protein